MCCAAAGVGVVIGRGFGILVFHGRTGGKARQKVVRGKHVSGKVRYGREERFSTQITGSGIE